MGGIHGYATATRPPLKDLDGNSQIGQGVRSLPHTEESTMVYIISTTAGPVSNPCHPRDFYLHLDASPEVFQIQEHWRRRPPNLLKTRLLVNRLKLPPEVPGLNSFYSSHVDNI